MLSGCGVSVCVCSLTSLAAFADPAGAAAAPSGPPVALAAVFTLALPLAVGPKLAHITLCKTSPGHEGASKAVKTSASNKIKWKNTPVSAEGLISYSE